MDVRLDDEAMKAIITKSIMDSLTPERREALIAEAIKGLLNAETGSGYNRRTKLQEAFDWAVQTVARDVAMSELAKDEGIKTKIREMFMAGWEKATTGEAGEKMAEKIGYAIEKAITGDRY
jgi:hypothetical protein